MRRLSYSFRSPMRMHCSIEPLTGLLAMLAFLCITLPEANAAQPGKSGERKAIPSQDVIEKLPADGGDAYNRLIFEKSPYLLQHASNPVDWYPWGKEAFDKAAREQKPIFLSVGYSTCHWCHVMEHESFEDIEVAKLINDKFVPIKVDREERPDIDHIYMAVTQAMTGRGGWPMTVFLTPDKKPFFAGTYFPRDSRSGQPGFMDLLKTISTAWDTQRDKVVASGNQIAEAIQSIAESRAGGTITTPTLQTAFQIFQGRFDSQHGGFGTAPKFPTPHQLSFLLRYYDRTGDQSALEMVEKTLQALRAGGIFDQVGFGFHRYSTDQEWLVPHFEKMLYDQALLAIAYVDAYQVTGKKEYADTARKVLDYVLRDMTSPEGGFYSAEDADSEGVEGKFYVWTRDDLQKVLGPVDAKVAEHVFNVSVDGNYHDEVTGKKTGLNILHIDEPIATLAKELNTTEAALTAQLDEIRGKLFSVRENRIHPHTDDKILSDWNGLMIAALARASQAFGDERYSSAAKRAADFVLQHLRDKNGRLLKSWRDGEAANAIGLLDDYAFMTWGLSELYEATLEPKYLQESISLTDLMLQHFWDEKAGGLFLTPDDGEKLLVRAKEGYDGAIPSGNSVAALNLYRLSEMTGQTHFAEKADKLMLAFSGGVLEQPNAHTQMLIAADYNLGPMQEVVIAGDTDSSQTIQMIETVQRAFLPRTVLVHRPSGEAPTIVQIAPYTAAQRPMKGQATAYVCRNHACNAPTTDILQLRRELQLKPLQQNGIIIKKTTPDVLTPANTKGQI